MPAGFGYNTNILGNLFQQGYGILNGSSGFGCNANPFTNCLGETNYDAVLGYSVFKAVASTTVSIVQNCMENKEEKVDYNQKIHETRTDIESKYEEIDELETQNTSSQTTIAEADSKIKSLNTELEGLNKTILAFKKIENADPKPENYAELELAADDAAKRKEAINKTDIPAQEKIKEEAEAQIKENNVKIDKLKEEIIKLESQKTAYEHAKAQEGGEYSLKLGFYDKEKNPSSEKALKTGLSKFKQALKSGDEAEIRRYATIVDEMYASNSTEFSKYKELYEQAKKWLEEHPEK